jgi:hypothetical protein
MANQKIFWKQTGESDFLRSLLFNNRIPYKVICLVFFRPRDLAYII